MSLNGFEQAINAILPPLDNFVQRLKIYPAAQKILDTSKMNIKHYEDLAREIKLAHCVLVHDSEDWGESLIQPGMLHLIVDQKLGEVIYACFGKKQYNYKSTLVSIAPVIDLEASHLSDEAM